MALKDDLIAYLASKTAITDIVSTDPARIRQGWTKQATPFPYITTDIPTHNNSHDLGGGAGFKEPEVEIQLWCRKESDRELLGEAVRGVLQGYRGTMGSTVVKAVTLPLNNDYDEPPRHSDQSFTFRRMMTFQFSIVESIPTYA